MRIRFSALLEIVVVGLCVQLAEGQVTGGRWSVGVRGGANTLSNDYSVTKVSIGGEVLAQYGLSPYYSVGMMAGYDALMTQGPPTGFGLGFNYLKIKCIPVGALAFLHPFPRKLFTLYLYAGAGAIAYQRTVDSGTPYPDNKFRFSSLIALGLGLEYFVRPSYSVILDGGLRFLGKGIDDVPSSTMRDWESIRVGLNIYLAGKAKPVSPAGK